MTLYPDLAALRQKLTEVPAITQREGDPESGLMHYRARSYDPRVGRFAQKEVLFSNR